MKKQIDNFTITDTDNKVVVDYDKTLKDWFDTFTILAIGLFLIVATYFLLEFGFREMSYIGIAIGLLCAVVAVWQSVSGVYWLFQTTKNLLVIDKGAKTVCSKHNPFKPRTFAVEDIQTLIVNGQNEKAYYTHRMIRTYCTVEARLKNKQEVRLFSINANRFLRPSAKKIEKELYSKARDLSLELNKRLKAKYRQTGYTEVE